MQKYSVFVIMLIIGAMPVFAATPTITDVTAKQRYPWNGLVDIDCKVTGINGITNGLKFALSAVMPDSGEARKVLNYRVVQNGVNSTDRMVYTNGTYRIVWDAKAEFGQVVYDNMVMRVMVVDLHDKVQLWEGGPYWADTNIGAVAPEDYGYYFWWGDTVGYTNTGSGWISVKDGSGIAFGSGSPSNSTYEKDNSALLSAGYIDATGKLVPEYDAAHVHWGGSWRMPTQQELSDLTSKCSWSETTMNGVKGWLVSGTGAYAPNSIFLPYAGGGMASSLAHVGSLGYYWSSVPDSYNKCAHDLVFGSDDRYTVSGQERFIGQSIRPVQGLTE